MPSAQARFTGLRVKASASGRSDPQFYSRAQWRAVRALVLEQQPLCSDPFGEHAGSPTPATDVHHKASRQWNPDRQYELENLEALCHSCHSRVTVGSGVRS